MATKQLYVTSPFKYNTRMMQAGEPVEMTGPHRRLYLALGKVSEERPKAVNAVAPTPAPEKPKAAPRKRKPKAKKTA